MYVCCPGFGKKTLLFEATGEVDNSWRLGWALEEAWVAPVMGMPKGLGNRLDA
jgi:hypothetical protein